jgi:hypothetical protein
MNLYDVLGVSPDADQDALRKAHRRAVRATHPDKGGNREDFEKVTHAYLVLRDPATRSRYDETGEHEVAPDNELAEIATILVGCFDQAMQSAGGRYTMADLIDTTRRALKDRKANAQASLAQMEEAAETFTEVRERLTFTGGGADVIAGGLGMKIAECQKLASQCRAEIANVERAEAYAADYGYRFDTPPEYGDWQSSLQAAMDQAHARKFFGV